MMIVMKIPVPGTNPVQPTDGAMDIAPFFLQTRHQSGFSATFYFKSFRVIPSHSGA
jgi:hypothetical protein